jgi:hypothetical protein
MERGSPWWRTSVGVTQDIFSFAIRRGGSFRRAAMTFVGA